MTSIDANMLSMATTLTDDAFEAVKKLRKKRIRKIKACYLKIEMLKERIQQELHIIAVLEGKDTPNEKATTTLIKGGFMGTPEEREKLNVKKIKKNPAPKPPSKIVPKKPPVKDAKKQKASVAKAKTSTSTAKKPAKK